MDINKRFSWSHSCRDLNIDGIEANYGSKPQRCYYSILTRLVLRTLLTPISKLPVEVSSLGIITVNVSNWRQSFMSSSCSFLVRHLATLQGYHGCNSCNLTDLCMHNTPWFFGPGFPGGKSISIFESNSLTVPWPGSRNPPDAHKFCCIWDHASVSCGHLVLEECSVGFKTCKRMNMFQAQKCLDSKGFNHQFLYPSHRDRWVLLEILMVASSWHLLNFWSRNRVTYATLNSM